MPPEKAAAASSGGVPTTHLGKEAAAGAASSGEIPQKKATPSSGGSAGSGALHGNSTSQYSEESAAGHPSKKARTASSLKIPQKHHKADISLSGGTLQKQSSEVEADTSSSGEVLHEQEHPKHFQESDPNEIVHAKEENKHVQEANHLIEQLNELGGMGEDISEEEFLAYHDKLPRIPCYIVARKLTNEELDEQDLRHALCRFRYYKYKLKEEGKEDTFDLKDVSEAECDQAFLKKQRFFRRFEEISTLDWYFHPDYCKDPSLSDYQRLVLRNYGSSEYARWTEYHEFLHSHDVEEEYVKFCEELFKKLEWMEGYLDFPRPSHKECKQSMAYDRTWYKDLDGVHFEIWCRVTEKQMSFRDALAEVCKLNRFPLRQRRLEGALKRDYTMERLESEYHTCTAKVPPGTEKDKAKELIAKAVKNRLNKPKTYAQYISKKIHIARVAGILPLKDSKEQCS
ncbi:uncharacterized protein [Aegilops tauschii subsp. strangulata]|uniref:Uncharacterized protein n=1 Tax=Aegilops tauschii subsp. strangulata TaxID=200361 RepID=A0A453ITD3_AEGTS